MLTLERLDALCVGRRRTTSRCGSACPHVKPIEDMARYLIGERDEPVEIINAGMCASATSPIEMPRSPLTPVMSREVWGEVYDRLAELIRQHRTTLIFVNQRRLADARRRAPGRAPRAKSMSRAPRQVSHASTAQCRTRLKAGR